jgi:transposase
MPPVDRNNPKRAASSESQYSLMEFMREFPDDEACLNHLWRTRYAPDGEHAYCRRCQTARRFKRYKGTRQRQAWKCTSCTQEISPTAGTIFHKSSTSLHLWFYAMWIITSTRCGVSAKQLERELGVTYKTAWRMFNLIRNRLMTQDYQGPLSGSVEADETWIGGKARAWPKRTRAEHIERKQTVFAAVERGGKVYATTARYNRAHYVMPHIREHVLPGSIVYTDESRNYDRLRRGYTHHRINHGAQIYVMGHVHTQTIEGFFSLVKNGIRGVYHSVSKKWLQGYLNEYAWRYNHRDDPEAMFKKLLWRATIS